MKLSKEVATLKLGQGLIVEETNTGGKFHMILIFASGELYIYGLTLFLGW